MELLRSVDPQGVTTRSQRRLTRRRYFNKVRVSKTNVRLIAVVHSLLSMTLIQSFLNFSMCHQNVVASILCVPHLLSKVYLCTLYRAQTSVGMLMGMINCHSMAFVYMAV